MILYNEFPYWALPEAILHELPDYVRLIVRWTKFANLESVLALRVPAIEASSDCDSPGISLLNGHGIEVPSDLISASQELAARRHLEHIGPTNAPALLFVDDNLSPMTADSFLAILSHATQKVRNSRDSASLGARKPQVECVEWLSRPNPIAIEDIANDIAKHLPKPFDLILEWTRYVPLDHLLRVHSLELCLFEPWGDDTIRLNWTDNPWIGLHYVVPDELVRRTLRYCSDDIRTCTLKDNMVFVIGDTPVTTDLFFNAIADALRHGRR